MKTKKSRKLTFQDRLSRLTYTSACQLLGSRGKELLQAGAQFSFDISRDAYLGKDLFRLHFADVKGPEPVVVTVTQMAAARQRLHWNCTACETSCEHVGAALSLLLEEKHALGLSDLPLEELPLEHLSEEQLIARALAERAQRAATEKFRTKSLDPTRPWTDYVITSAASGKSYRVALRGPNRGESFCSCPDFRTNTLGTCKHVLHVLRRLRNKFSSARLARRAAVRECCVHLQYGDTTTLRFQLPSDVDSAVAKIAQPLVGGPIDDVPDLLKRVARIEGLGCPVIVYPDAEEFIQQKLHRLRVNSLVAEIRQNPARHPLRKELLRTELLPYQLDGIAFAAGAGRAVLADDMGLGKTIQAVGVAELLARAAGIRKVLVICPASLKSQWQSEIRRFSTREVQLVFGSAEQRCEQYNNDAFFTIGNYEQVLRDITAIQRVNWDFIILDEGQRIKNWESKTSTTIKSLKSPFALVLSGTPLENRLDELYSVVQFIDDQRLAPAFRFFNRHRVVDEDGRVIGYKNLDQLRDNLRPLLLRRTRAEVLTQLPERSTEIVRISPTAEQLEVHNAHIKNVSTILRKHPLTEMDLLRLQKELLICRMAADSTFLVDKQEPSYSSKLEYLQTLFEQLFAEADRKAVLFSEWTTMLDLIEPLIKRVHVDYVRLDGSVPQQKRKQLVDRFQRDPRCRLFITTNAGSTGLNLQAANTVVNVDLPWNPAVLEQRIARAHRMGQKNPVQVFVLVTEHTIEEKLLKTLEFKQNLADAALDLDSEITSVDFDSGIEALKRRLEVLVGSKPDAPIDVSEQQRMNAEAEKFAAQRERVAAAGGELLGAVFQFVDALVTPQLAAPPAELVEDLRQRLQLCSSQDERGRQALTLTLPDSGALDQLASTLARLLVTNGAANH